MQVKREVTLGDHTYLVIPQGIGWLTHKLGPRLQEAVEADIEGIDGLDVLGAKAHSVLSAFIPDVMPLHEFLGYASSEAMREGTYDPAADRSPNILDVEEAFKAASDVNGGRVLAALKALLGPELSQKAVAAITSTLAEKLPSVISDKSPTSPSTSGGSESTSSSTPDPTPPTPVSAA